MPKITTAALALPLLFAACAGPKPAAQRFISVEEVNGIRSRADSADRELAAEMRASRPETAPLPAASPVKIIKKTPGALEFEAEGEGSSTRYERPIDAEKRAEDDALSKAVKAAGVNVYSGLQDIMAQYGDTSYQFVGKYLSTWSNALVSYEKTAPAACLLDNGINRCSVKIRGTVYFRGEADPVFELKAALDKPAYFQGDGVNMTLSVTKDAYISVISCDEDGNAALVFPNRYTRDNFLKAGRALNLPRDLAFRLNAFLPEGRSESAELAHIIATKDQPLFALDALKEEGESGFVKYSLGGLKELAVRLAKFPRSAWTSRVLVYEVKKK